MSSCLDTAFSLLTSVGFVHHIWLAIPLLCTHLDDFSKDRKIPNKDLGHPQSRSRTHVLASRAV